jgi:hypothetical protein
LPSPEPGGPVVERTPQGANVLVDGVVRATFVGDLGDPVGRDAFGELLAELFPDAQVTGW